jgi:hypothetical protein
MAATTPPLSLGEILDRTVQLYRRNFLLLLGISFLPAAIDVLITGSGSIFLTSQAPQLQTSPSVQAFFTFFGAIAGFLLIGLPLLVAIFSVALSALNLTAFQRSHGVEVTIREAYAYAFRHLWRYLGIFALQLLFAAVIPSAVFAGIVFIGAMLSALVATSGAGPAFAILAGILAVVLVIALIVAAISIWLRFCLAFPVCVTEQTRVWPSLQRSNRLTKGSRGRIFVMYLLVFILTMVAFYALDLPVQILLKLTVFKSTEMMALLSKPPLLLQVVNLFISFLERSFVMPIYAIALVLFYNDQRTRQEGYDIELLMAQAGLFNVPPPIPAQPIPSPEPFAEPTTEFTASFTAVPASESPDSPPAPAKEPFTLLEPLPAADHEIAPPARPHDEAPARDFPASESPAPESSVLESPTQDAPGA